MKDEELEAIRGRVGADYGIDLRQKYGFGGDWTPVECKMVADVQSLLTALDEARAEVAELKSQLDAQEDDDTPNSWELWADGLRR